MSLSGLAKVFANTEQIRERLLATDSLISWPSPKLVLLPVSGSKEVKTFLGIKRETYCNNEKEKREKKIKNSGVDSFF